MPASYPTTPKTFTTKVDGPGNIIFASHVNDLQDEVTAVEQALLTTGFAHNLIPSTADARDVGSAASRWRDAFIGRNFIIGSAALATTATDGFAYLTTMAGTPTGVPTAHTGRGPIVLDSTNNLLYGYLGGAWRNLSGSSAFTSAVTVKVGTDGTDNTDVFGVGHVGAPAAGNLMWYAHIDSTGQRIKWRSHDGTTFVDWLEFNSPSGLIALLKTIEVSGNVDVLTGSLHTRAVTPAQITSNQNDYNPGSHGFWRVSSDAARDITGIAGGADGRLLIFYNIGSFTITLKHQNVGSAASNRFLFSSGADALILAGESARLIYDSTTQRWRNW